MNPSLLNIRFTFVDFYKKDLLLPLKRRRIKLSSELALFLPYFQMKQEKKCFRLKTISLSVHDYIICRLGLYVDSLYLGGHFDVFIRPL